LLQQEAGYCYNEGQWRNDAYRELKARVLDDIITDMERVVSGSGCALDYKELATPRAGHYSIRPGGIVFSALTRKLVTDGMYEGFAKALLW